MALKVWRFCDGWNPERIPLAAAFHGVEDVELLIEHLMIIREAIRVHKAAQEKK